MVPRLPAPALPDLVGWGGGNKLKVRFSGEAATTPTMSVRTARNHLKRVFQKRETHRQAELVRLVLSSCALLAD